MVTTATKHAVAAGGMEEAWKTWQRVLPANRTWNLWKDHWTACFQEKRELIKLTGSSFNGMANQAHKDEMGDKMFNALDNLANTAVQRNDTFETMVKSNNTQMTIIESQMAEIKKLTAIIFNLSTKPKNDQQSTTNTKQ